MLVVFMVRLCSSLVWCFGFVVVWPEWRVCCWICVFAAVLVELVVILLGFGCLLGRLCCLIVLVILSCVYW